MRRIPLHVILFAVAAATSSSAAPLCVSGLLSTYSVAGFACETDGATSNNFSFQGTGSITTTALDETQITVSPLSGPNQVGLNFAGQFESTGTVDSPSPAGGNLAVTYRIMFDVDRPGSEFLAATTAITNPSRFSPNPLKFGGITVGKNIANDGANAITSDTDPDLMEMTFLFNPRQTIFVDDMVTLVGGASAAGTAAPVGFVTLESFDNLFLYEVVVPEPGTLSLLSGGAFLFWLMRRRGPRGLA